MKLVILKNTEKIDIEVALISMVFYYKKMLEEKELDEKNKKFIEQQIKDYNKLIKKID